MIVNKDLEKTNEELQNQVKDAIESGDVAKQAEAMSNLMEYTAQKAANDVKKAMQIAENDDAIMTARGVKLLTSEEKKYFTDFATQIKNEGQGLSNVEITMPTTSIDRIFEDLEQEHPILQIIDFQNVTGLIETIVRTGDVSAAWWGKLTDDIKKQLESGFDKKAVNLYKLSAFLPICKAHLDLGPVWLESFVRKFIVEALSLGLESAIATGTGKNDPIGMNRDLEGAVVEGVYPEKKLIKVKDLTPKTMGALIAPLTNNGKRAITKVLMIVNPVDYLTRIFPQTTILNSAGTYVNNVLPFPTDIIQLPSIQQGKAILGVSKKYFMGLGSERKIEKSDEYKFIEDERVYIGKLYGNGFPKDNNSFEYLDISEMEKATLEQIENTNKTEGTEQTV